MKVVPPSKKNEKKSPIVLSTKLINRFEGNYGTLDREKKTPFSSTILGQLFQQKKIKMF
jgi:hypothetical protein